MMMKLLTTKLILLLATLASAAAASADTLLLNEAEQLPDTGNDWISLSESVEFQPAASEAAREIFRLRPPQTQSHRHLSAYSDKFVDGHETYYDEYAQAWRLLGFYVDCSSSSNAEQQEERRRRLDDDDYGCPRYLVWAAYVDLDYQGGGIGEYQYYDATTQTWDTSACQTHGNGRCAKMDCHLAGSHWKLLGFFKHADYTDWFGQLFKHLGYCVWSSAEYNFMSNSYGVWPEGCAQSEISSDSGYLYYDLKPLPHGNVGLGVYTDARCSQEYTGSVNLNSLLSENCDDDGGGCSNSSLDQFLSQWNAAMDIYKICQPCKSYNLGKTSGYDDQYYNNDDDAAEEANDDGNNNADDGGYGGYGGYDNEYDEGGNDDNGDEERRRRRLEDYDEDNDVNNGYFTCSDDAGYTNVNQCMKFATQTNMYRASFNDMSIAGQQGSLTKVYVPGIGPSGIIGYQQTWGFLTAAICVFVFGLLFCAWATKRARRRNPLLVEPLISSSNNN